jgi:hypothetical protein
LGTFSDISSVKPRKIEFNNKKKPSTDIQQVIKNNRIPLVALSIGANKKTMPRSAYRQDKKSVPNLKSDQLFNKYPMKKAKENSRPPTKLSSTYKQPTQIANQDSSIEPPSMRSTVPLPEAAEQRPKISHRI